MLAFLVLLTISGAVLSGLAIYFAAHRLASARFWTQKDEADLNVNDLVDATLHDDPAAIARVAQSDERRRLRGTAEDQERPLTHSEFVRRELGLPAALGVLGVFVSTVASVLSLLATTA